MRRQHQKPQSQQTCYAMLPHTLRETQSLHSTNMLDNAASYTERETQSLHSTNMLDNAASYTERHAVIAPSLKVNKDAPQKMRTLVIIIKKIKNKEGKV